MLAWIAEHHASAGMIGALRTVDRLHIALLVERIDTEPVDEAGRLAGFSREGRGGSRLHALGVGYRQGQRDRPGVRLAAADDHFFVEDAIPLLAGHRTDERAERAVGDAIERRLV